MEQDQGKKRRVASWLTALMLSVGLGLVPTLTATSISPIASASALPNIETTLPADGVLSIERSGNTWTVTTDGNAWEIKYMEPGPQQIICGTNYNNPCTPSETFTVTGDCVYLQVDWGGSGKYNSSDPYVCRTDQPTPTIVTGTYSAQVLSCTPGSKNEIQLDPVAGGVWTASSTLHGSASLPIGEGYTGDQMNGPTGYVQYTITLTDGDATDNRSVTPLSFTWTPVDPTTLDCTTTTVIDVPVSPLATEPTCWSDGVLPTPKDGEHYTFKGWTPSGSGPGMYTGLWETKSSNIVFTGGSTTATFTVEVKPQKTNCLPTLAETGASNIGAGLGAGGALLLGGLLLLARRYWNSIKA